MAFRSNILIVYLNILIEMGMLQLKYSRYIISKDEISLNKFITIVQITHDTRITDIYTRDTLA